MTKLVLSSGSSVKFNEGAERYIPFEKRRTRIAFADFPAVSMSKHNLSVSFVNNVGVKRFYRELEDFLTLVIVSQLCLQS